jgi:hypothetical protein
VPAVPDSLAVFLRFFVSSPKKLCSVFSLLFSSLLQVRFSQVLCVLLCSLSSVLFYSQLVNPFRSGQPVLFCSACFILFSSVPFVLFDQFFSLLPLLYSSPPNPQMFNLLLPGTLVLVYLLTPCQNSCTLYFHLAPVLQIRRFLF